MIIYPPTDLMVKADFPLYLLTKIIELVGSVCRTENFTELWYIVSNSSRSTNRVSEFVRQAILIDNNEAA